MDTEILSDDYLPRAKTQNELTHVGHFISFTLPTTPAVGEEEEEGRGAPIPPSDRIRTEDFLQLTDQRVEIQCHLMIAHVLRNC